MKPPQSRAGEFYRFFIRGYPLGTLLMVFLMFLAGLAEGIGVLALVPVLEFGAAGEEPTSAAGRAVVSGVRWIGLEPTLGVLLLGIVLAITMKSALLWLAEHHVGVMVARVVRDLRMKLIRSLFEVRWSYFAERKLGQFANAITSEAVRIGAAYREASHVLAATLQMLAYFAIAAVISWKIALGTVVAGAIITTLMKAFFRRSRAVGSEETALNKALSSRLMDVLQGLKPLKAMGRQNVIRPILEAETEGLNRAQRREVLVNASLKALQEPILTILLAGGLYFLLVISDQTLSSVLVLAFVFYRLMQHMNTIQMRYQIMTHGEGAFGSFVDELELAVQQREPTGGSARVERLERDIRFEDVTFAYDVRPVLENASFAIPAGSFVALSGESGAGKTTLADLIVGLVQPQSGRILIDGTPLDEIHLETWRHTIGYVPQEMLLLNDTIYRNVTLGDETVPRGEVDRALKLAGASQFVEQLPEGMDAMVGERGTSLSGGQRQRIAIARALISRPSLLVLDEVTTALDPVTEQEICTTLQSLAHEMTVLAISHQPAMRNAADTIFVLKDRQIIQRDPATSAARATTLGR